MAGRYSPTRGFAPRPGEVAMGSVALDEKELEKADYLRVLFADLYDSVGMVIGPSRERALALTNLEQACMWAVKGIVPQGEKGS